MSTAEPLSQPSHGTETTLSDSNSNADVLEAIRDICSRLDILERRFEHLDRAVLNPIPAESEPVLDDEIEPGPPSRRVPAFALTSDGRILLSTLYLQGADISGREMWTGVAVTEAEACDALDALSDAADDIAGHVAGRIVWNKQKKKRGSSDGSPSELT